MYFEFFKLPGNNWQAIVKVIIQGKSYHFHTGAQKSKSDIINKTFKFIREIPKQALA